MADKRKKASRADRRKERDWIDEKLAKLKAEAAKLPAKPQDQLKRDLDEKRER